MKLRIVSIITAFLMAAFALVGCVGSNYNGAAEVDDSAANEIKNLTVTFNLVDGNAEKDTDGGEGQSEQTDSPEDPARLSLKDAIKKIRYSVVEIYATTSSGVTNAGSGVVIATATTEGGEEGENTGENAVYSYVVTCYNVVKDASTVLVKDVDGNEYTAKPVGADSDTDICVLSVESLLRQADIYMADTYDAGEEVIAIGNPLGILGGTVTRGIICASNRHIVSNRIGIDLLQTDAVVVGGNSGGGLFNSNGELIGIINSKYNASYFNSVEGFSFAIPSTIVENIACELMETYTGEQLGYIRGKYYLGCNVANVYPTAWMAQSTVIISWLDKTGSFYKAGLRAGDQVTSVSFGNHDEIITTAAAFSEYIDSLNLKVGDELTVNVRRDDRYAHSFKVEILQYICGAE